MYMTGQISSHESFTMLGFELCMLLARLCVIKPVSTAMLDFNFTDPATQ